MMTLNKPTLYSINLERFHEFCYSRFFLRTRAESIKRIVFLQTVVESHLRLVPRDSVVRIGVNVTLECSTSPSLFVNWEFTSFDSGGTIDVSAGPIVFNPSKYGLETDTEAGNFHLIVRSVTAVDAGRYTCIDDGGLGDRYSAELTVIGKCR